MRIVIIYSPTLFNHHPHYDFFCALDLGGWCFLREFSGKRKNCFWPRFYHSFWYIWHKLGGYLERRSKIFNMAINKGNPIPTFWRGEDSNVSYGAYTSNVRFKAFNYFLLNIWNFDSNKISSKNCCVEDTYKWIVLIQKND